MRTTVDDNAHNAIMTTLNIRNLPKQVHMRLRVRAARRGRSMEAEARDILTRVCTGKKHTRSSAGELQTFVDELYGKSRPTGVVDDLIAERRREAELE